VARQIIRPAVMDLVELATATGPMELAIEEFIGSLKGCEGKVLGETLLGVSGILWCWPFACWMAPFVFRLGVTIGSSPANI
jgi:hypothetical protein